MGQKGIVAQRKKTGDRAANKWQGGQKTCFLFAYAKARAGMVKELWDYNLWISERRWI